ncbi:hypothetical protein LTR95_004804 [Oleoguttula sp. CCFEE 5521]
MSVDTRLKVQQLLENGLTRHAENNAQLLQMATSAAVQHSQIRSNIESAYTTTRIQVIQLANAETANHARTQKVVRSGTSAIRGDIASIDGVHTRERFLEGLRFDDMTRREESIKPAWADTYQWIFDETDASTYWISGKAGSGKSTLMGYVNDNPRFDAALRLWAGSEAYIRLTFFFWRAGSSMQKSVTGLLRSILHQLCHERSDILSEIASSFNGLFAWTEAKLLAALRRALEMLQQVRVVVMVDGLDELEGDHERLIDVLSDITKGTMRKLCIASRPETVLAHRLFSTPNLRLEELNHNDIWTYVIARLQAVPSELRWKLTGDIIYKSSGVFLWAVLVTKSIMGIWQVMTARHCAND